MKKVLSCLCVCLLLFSGMAYAASHESLNDKITEISVALETSDNVEELLGEAVLLMIENDILTSLETKGEAERAIALKANADEALDAAANNSEDEREKAIAFCDKLSEAITAAYNLLVNGDFSNTALDGTAGWIATDTTANITILENWPGKDNNTLSGNVLYWSGTGAGATQVVSGLKEETAYSLSMNVYTYRAANKSNRITATVTFGTTDTAGTFTSLAAGMQGGILEDANNAVDSDAVITVYKKDAVQSATLNFTLPKGANAVVVELTGDGLGSGGQAFVDDVTLVEASTPIEKVTNGGFEILGGKTGLLLQSWSLSNNTLVNYEAGEDNNYLKLSAEDVNATQRMLVKPGKVYKLSFKFAQTGFSGEVAPNVNFSVPALNEISTAYTVEPTYIGAEATGSISWNRYETLVTFDDPGEGYDFGLINAGLMLNSPEVDWEDGAAVYYDDISLEEIDVETTSMGFSIGTNGEFTTTPSEAKAASLIFLQSETPTVQKFVVAKYNKATNALEKVMGLVNAGEGIKAGNAKRYDVELDAYSAASYYRIFLWDGATLKPILDSQSSIG